LNDYPDKIPLVTPREVAEERRTNLTHKKAPGFDLITGKFLRTLKRKALVKLTTLINACIRLNYIPDAWKTAEVIMILKPGRNLREVDSYQPISVLLMMSKLFEKLILKHFKTFNTEKHLVPNHQFGFRKNHSTIDQVHRITDIIEKTFENKGMCSAVFLDIAQAFDRVWHRGLLHNLRSVLPDHFYQLLKSYLANRHFHVKREDRMIRAGIPQGSVLVPVIST
jgi:hypothetical protein